jgi:hypothetical protein
MELKQATTESAADEIRRQKLMKTKDKFRLEQRKLSFNEKMQIAFSLSERDRQLRKARKIK